MPNKVPPRPVFRGADIDADQFHADANNARLEHIMTLLEVLIQSIEDFRKDVDDIDRGRNA